MGTVPLRELGQRYVTFNQKQFKSILFQVITLNHIYKQFAFASFLKQVGVAVRKHRAGFRHVLDVLEDNVVVANTEDKNTPVESLLALCK